VREFIKAFVAWFFGHDHASGCGADHTADAGRGARREQLSPRFPGLGVKLHLAMFSGVGKAGASGGLPER
jgi:hypothetical protein